MFFQKLSHSWELAKLSYSIIWDYKKLLVFPVLSTLAAVVVLVSFALPLWGTGAAEQWLGAVEAESGASTGQKAAMGAVAFAFYFANYFVIVFFNAALIACTMKAVNGEEPTIGYGLSAAARRLGPIAQWALVSAIVGVLLRAIENVHERAGQLIAWLLGTAWTAMTYFVVPALVIEGVGPVEGVKRSLSILKGTWGEALMANFSLGFIGLLVAVPAVLVAGLLMWMAASAGSVVGMVLAGALALVLIVAAVAAISAADVVLQALLYHYATGRSIPEGIDRGTLADAFVHRG